MCLSISETELSGFGLLVNLALAETVLSVMMLLSETSGLLLQQQFLQLANALAKMLGFFTGLGLRISFSHFFLSNINTSLLIRVKAVCQRILARLKAGVSSLCVGVCTFP